MSDNSKCETGCQVFTGGEIRHHKDCVYYPDSLTKMTDDLRAQLEQTQKDNTVYRRELQHALTYLDSLGAMEPHEPEAQMRESFHRVMRGEQVPDTSIERDECGVETQSSWSRRQVDTNALPYAEVKRRLEGLTRAAWRVMHHWNIFKEPSLKEVMAELSYAVQDADAQITAPAEGDNHG